jgi:hypothetical protein
MATSFSIGHNARRRAGIPSNPLETVGSKMRKHQTAEEATVAAAAAGSARISVGSAQAAGAVSAAGTMSSVDELNPSQMQGTLVAKKSTQAGDPTGGGMGPGRSPVLNVGGERLGGSYKVKASLGITIDPAAGATMANAKIIPSVQGRANPNFESGMQASSI